MAGRQAGRQASRHRVMHTRCAEFTLFNKWWLNIFCKMRFHSKWSEISTKLTSEACVTQKWFGLNWTLPKQILKLVLGFIAAKERECSPIPGMPDQEWSFRNTQKSDGNMAISFYLTRDTYNPYGISVIYIEHVIQRDDSKQYIAGNILPGKKVTKWNVWRGSLNKVKNSLQRKPWLLHRLHHRLG